MSIAPRNWTVVALDPAVAPTACVLWNRGRSVRFYDGPDLARHRISAADVMVGAATQGRAKNKARQFDPRLWSAVLEWAHPHLVVIEAVWVRPNQGRSSQAKLVYVMGAAVGAAAALSRNLLFLRPTTWTGAYGLHDSSLSIANRKRNRNRVAIELGKDAVAPYLQRAKDHNRADAFLMAHLGMQMLDQAYERAVRNGASVEFTPEVWTMR